MRPVDADYLIELANQEGAYGYVDAWDIAHAPTVDAEPVRHGHWETIGGGIFVQGDSYAVRFKCSICGHFVNLGTDRNYCPNCGAKMDGERREEWQNIDIH